MFSSSCSFASSSAALAALSCSAVYSLTAKAAAAATTAKAAKAGFINFPIPAKPSSPPTASAEAIAIPSSSGFISPTAPAIPLKTVPTSPADPCNSSNWCSALCAECSIVRIDFCVTWAVCFAAFSVCRSCLFRPPIISLICFSDSLPPARNVFSSCFISALYDISTLLFTSAIISPS